MHSIKLFLLQTGQSWTLKPNREYVIGNGQDCDIPFSSSDLVSTHQLKFGFDTVEDSWYAEALGSTNALIGTQALTRNLIREQMQITVGASIVLVATPEGASQMASNSSSQTADSYPSRTSNYPDRFGSNYSAYVQTPNPIHSSGNSARAINLGFKWFKISSPDDGVGLEFSHYRLFQTYRADREKVQRVCEKLYEHVLSKVNEGCVGDAKIISFMYKKGLDDRRKFIRISRDTVHGVRTTIFIRFLSYGDNLYIALNVYVLGDFNWIRFLLKVLLTLVLFIFSWAVVPLVLIVLMWWKLVWRISYEGKMSLAFRQEFPGGMGTDLFNIDDIVMFAKSTVHLTVTAIHDVFEEEGLPLASLDAYIQQINNITNNNIDTGGGDIVSSAIGAANKLIGNQTTVSKG